MKRLHTLLYIMVCCSSILLAQANRGNYQLSQYRYWFDNETVPHIADYTEETAAIDASALDEGFHTLHFQVITDQSQVSPTRTTSFYRLHPSGETFKSYTVQSVRYWFDAEREARTVAYVAGTANIDASALDEGFHTLHYQVITSLDQASPTRTVSFYRVNTSGETFKGYTIQDVRYWFDAEKEARTVAYVAGTANIDASALDEGFHTLHYQVITDLDQASPTRTVSFYRVNTSGETFKGYTVQDVRYWFDAEKEARTVAYEAGTANIDASALDEGFHTLHYQVITDLDQASPTRTVSFYRVNTSGETFKGYTVQDVRYWFDAEKEARTVAYSSGTANIDISALDEGFHTFHYQVVTGFDQASPTRTISFYRFKHDTFKDYTVSHIRYWTDNDYSTVRLEPYVAGTNVLNLHHLTEDAHTLCYQAVTDDGQVSPVRSIAIERWFYDIYVSKTEEYTDSIVNNSPIFGSRPDLKLHFKSDDINVRGHLTINEDVTLSLGKFVQTANWGKQTSNKYTKTGADYFHPTTLLNYGFMRADSVIVKQSLYRDLWHFISLPFNVNVADIDVPEGTYWALRSYDGEARAAGEMTNTWQNLQPADVMKARSGYIVQFTMEGNDNTTELTFKAKNDLQKNNIFTSSDVTIPLEEHQAEFAHNRSWNLIGNPYPSFFDTRYISQDGNIIVWNGNGYSAYSLTDDNYILMPFEAFFIQRPVNSETLTFSKEGRQHTHEVVARAAVQARRIKNTGADRRILNFTLTDSTGTDRSRVVINEQASLTYEADKDAPKFMEAKPQIAQLFSVESGVKYAINERPMGDGTITFSVYAPVAGEYTLSVDTKAEMLEQLIVYDTATGSAWPLADGDYVFTAEAGMHNARLIVSFVENTPTAIAQVLADEDGEVRIVGNQLSFHFAKANDFKVFSMDGRKLYDSVTTAANITLQRGIYVICVNGISKKIMIK